MAQAIRDRFANIASLRVVQSAANTLTFASLATNMGFIGRRDQALAMVIDEIQWHIDDVTMDGLVAAADRVMLALCVSNSLTDITDYTDRRILALYEIGCTLAGTAGNAFIHEQPAVKQFFPPLITAERTLFLAVDGNSIPATVTAQCRILFRVETLTAGELVELAEVFRLTS